MSAVVTQDEGSAARPLRVLVSLIKEDLKRASDAAQEASKPYFISIGQKMAEARDGNGWSIGQLSEWTKRNFDIGRSQTLMYLRVANATSALSAPEQSSFNSLDDFRRRVLGHDRVPGSQRDASWQEPIKENIQKAQREAARLNEETLSRQQERDAERKLAMQLIDIGFRALASKLHPDKGGSRDAMSRLNRVRDRLKQHA
jgi:hypothetical protein